MKEAQKPAKIKLPSLQQIKKALYADWSLQVKQLDSWRCLLCPETQNLTSHHWFVSDHFAKAARYCVNNGATLCYACHIRGIHTRADKMSIDRLVLALAQRRFPIWNLQVAEMEMKRLSETELTTAVLRELWDDMRARPIKLNDRDALVTVRGGKLFVSTDATRQIAVVGNTMLVPGFGLCEVRTLAPDGISGGFRYTVAKLDKETP